MLNIYLSGFCNQKKNIIKHLMLLNAGIERKMSGSLSIVQLVIYITFIRRNCELKCSDKMLSCYKHVNEIEVNDSTPIKCSTTSLFQHLRYYFHNQRFTHNFRR